MAEPLAEAYVRVRPETSGFKEELRTGVENSGAEEIGDRHGKRFGAGFVGGVKSSLTNAKADLAKSFETDFANVAKAASGGGIGGILKALFLTPQGLAVAVPATVMAGEMIGGALLTGIGLAGIGAGIALEFKDPRIQPAVHQLKHDIGSGLKDAAEPFVTPLREGLDILDTGFKAELPGLKTMFAEIAPEVAGLARGGSGFLSGVVRGFESAAVAAKPLVRDFGEYLPTLGNQIGHLFVTMGQHAAEAEQGLHLLEDTVSGLVVISDKAIPVISKVGEVLKYANTYWETKQLLGMTEDTNIHIGRLGTSALDAARGFREQGAATDTLTLAVRRLNDAMTTTINNELLLSGDADAYKRALLGMGDAIDKNGKSLKDNTIKGLDNREMLRQLVAAAEKQREDAITVAGGQNASADAIDAANAKYRQQIKDIEDHAAKVGYDKKAVDDFVTSLDGIPATKKITFEMVTTGNVSTGDLTTLIGGKGIKFRAGGGNLDPGDLSWVGENGPELVRAGRGGAHVTSNADLRALTAMANSPAAAAAAGASAPVINLTARVYVGDTELRDVIRVEIDDYDQATAAAVAGGPRH